MRPPGANVLYGMLVEREEERGDEFGENANEEVRRIHGSPDGAFD